ncbi:MAG: hypothetical protein K9L82_17330 [Chromatiaceae bacterium]|nr:hypothetical protein [Chromatiaceae bacterium]
MHPLQAGNLYELAAAAHAAVSAAKETDDGEQAEGLVIAAEYLTSELKRITWELVETSEFPDESPPRIDPVIARSLNPMCDLRDLVKAIAQQTGDELNADEIKLVECNGDPDGWLVMDKDAGGFHWHVALDGRLTRQSEG